MTDNPSVTIEEKPSIDLEAIYPLERTWAVWWSGGRKLPGRGAPKGRHDTRRNGKVPPSAPEITRAGAFDSIQTFWCWFNNLPPPSRLAVDANLFIFQDGIDPAWEHPDNKEGGRWVTSATALPDDSWRDLVLGLVGETLDLIETPEITGLVLSRRRAYFRVSVWTRNKTKDTEVMTIGRRAKDLLAVPGMEYQDHAVGYDAGYRHVV